MRVLGKGQNRRGRSSSSQMRRSKKRRANPRSRGGQDQGDGTTNGPPIGQPRRAKGLPPRLRPSRWQAVRLSTRTYMLPPSRGDGEKPTYSGGVAAFGSRPNTLQLS